MSWYPGAIRKEVPRFKTRMAVYNRMNLHIAVSEAASLHGYFNRPGNPCSHFYVRRDGNVEQYVDTTYRAAADLDGNDATISVETQGMGDGEWTSRQVAALAALFAWARQTHGLPDKTATDSLPGQSSRGLSWHRLGIDPWRRPGGIRYSTARGKVCPGDARTAQIPTILTLSRGQQGTQPEEDIMASIADLRAVLTEKTPPQFRRRGQEAAWMDLGTHRRWPGRAVYEAMGFPPIIDLDPSDPFWSLPTVGTLPPEGA